MILRRKTFVEVNTTPGELRKLADRLDSAFSKAKLGETVPFEDIERIDSLTGERIVVRFSLDQEEVYQERKD